MPKGAFDPLGLSFIVLIIVIFYVLLILPAQREKKAHEKMLKNLKAGDKVILSSGIYGTIGKIDENTVHLKIADKTTIVVAKNSISTVVKE